jgi:hypothetical protein
VEIPEEDSNAAEVSAVLNDMLDVICCAEDTVDVVGCAVIVRYVFNNELSN